jgi:methyltransferase (TIGR00027 family)
MREGEGSRTADRVAERRAAHQLLDRPLVFEDPLAVQVLQPGAAERLRDGDRSPLAPYLRAFMAMRSRFAEDALADAVMRGIDQYVILGAGFDTFAYRNPHPALRVFEVDHPDTQRVKTSRLAHAGIEVPPSLTFVPIDFAVASIAAELPRAGFDPAAPAFFSWLGVVPYLERDAIDATLSFIAAGARGSAVVFDYAIPPASLGWRARWVVDRMAERVAQAGEPWKTFFDPSELSADLRRIGFTSIADYGSEELNARYFAGRNDGLKLGSAGRIVLANV